MDSRKARKFTFHRGEFGGGARHDSDRTDGLAIPGVSRWRVRGSGVAASASMIRKIALLLVLLSSPHAFAGERDDGPEPDLDNVTVQLLILGVSRNHAGLQADAKKAAAELGYAFSDRGLVYDDEKGLRWPDDDADEAWAGGYFQRRSDDCGPGPGSANGCITIEKSDAYHGLKPGYFVIVAGVLGEEDDARKRLADVRHVVRDAYLSETTVYMGCIH
jgi:hypothetical protein